MGRQSIAVFCGSSTGNRPEFAAAARATAAAIVGHGARLVYGAGSVGLMGILADEVLRLGGEVVGVIPQFLVDLEVGHRGLTELIITESMHERKLAMAERSDAFLALPGGIGTLEELIEVFTWTQLGIHDKHCGLLNVNGYYDPLTDLLETMVTNGFLRAEHAGALLVGEEPGELLGALL